MSPLFPGATIGFIGGGQLARMSAMAARTLGFRVLVLDPQPKCSAKAVADEVIVARFDDQAAILKLAERSDVITWEIESVDSGAAKAAAAIKPLRPGAQFLELVQNKAVQKQWLKKAAFEVGDFWHIKDLDQFIKNHSNELENRQLRLKACRGGYDGRSQMRLKQPSSADALRTAWQQIGADECILEEEIDLQEELSVLVARTPSGSITTHPVSQNWHRNSILDVSLIPAKVNAQWIEKTTAIAKQLAEKLRLEGILTIEFFADKMGRILVNELAPRPHNTFHTTQAGCITSQFEQHIRAICDLPLGNTECIRPTALANLLGDAWLNGTPSGFEQALAMPGVQLHLYDKEARPNRKIGHILASDRTGKLALEKVRNARDLIEKKSAEP